VVPKDIPSPASTSFTVSPVLASNGERTLHPVTDLPNCFQGPPPGRAVDPMSLCRPASPPSGGFDPNLTWFSCLTPTGIRDLASWKPSGAVSWLTVICGGQRQPGLGWSTPGRFDETSR
jgi:hypothetical protein